MIRRTFRVPGNPEPVDVIWFSLREQEVLGLVCQGKSSKDMARILDISPDTVRACTARMGRAVGASNRGEFILWGLKHPEARQPGGSVVLDSAVAPELVLPS
jgi:DNA-binding CsgD family transcriptional regulator